MKSRVYLLTGVVLIFVAAVSLVRAEEGKKDQAKKEETKKDEAPKTGELKQAVEQAASAPPVAASKRGTPIALTVEALQELDERKNALDLREKQLAEKARDLEIQEKLLKEKLKKMEELNKKMADRLDVFKKEHEGKITKLVTVVEGMKPEAAARYVETLDPALAVEILTRIKETKASKILNLVDKKVSAKLTELYTGYREVGEEPAVPPAPASAPVPAQQSAKEETPIKKPM